MNEAFEIYFDELKKNSGTEMTFRTPIENLLNAIKGDNHISITHEPQRESGFGAPDFKIESGGAIIGYVETKALNEDLGKILKTDQLKRYQTITENIILTNYREFILLKNGETVALFQTMDLEKTRSKLDDTKAEYLKKLFEHFFRTKPEPIGKIKPLALALAERGKILKEFVEEELAEEAHGPFTNSLHNLFDDYRKMLIDEMKPHDFADAFVQTIIYGLILARLEKDGKVSHKNAYDFVPKSIPLIHGVLELIGRKNPPDHMQWIYEEIVNTVNNMDPAGIAEELAFYGGEHANDDYDPFFYFYEPFLQEFDAIQKRERGVYYTPIPVVSFIARSLNRILEEDFKKQDGFCATDVTVLDFACGTGTFLAEIFRLMLDNMKNHGNAGQIPKTISKHILKNFYGFEFLIAPYAVAHLKLSQLLKEIGNGYDLGENERLQVFLTDTLENREHKRENPSVWEMAEESRQAEAAKRTKILVVTGNPPYNVGSTNKGEWILEEIKDYKPEGERNIQPLSDDYVKFIRFAHFKMENVEQGAIGIITNNSFINGLIHRKMRAELLKTFDEIYILNLHGNARIGETAPDGGKDENVFDIMQGVCISFFVKTGSKKERALGQTQQPVGQAQNPVGQTQNPVGQTFLSVPSANEQAGMPVLPTDPTEGTLRITKRKLPHWTIPGSYYFVTFSSKGSMLSQKEREMVFSHVIEGSKKFYELFALVVMPEHVHLILKPNADRKLSEIMKGIKGVSARLINKERGTKGNIWLEESYDRIIRDEEEYNEKLNYILQNPVKADLVENGKYPFLFIEGIDSLDSLNSVDSVVQTFLSEQSEQAGMPVLPIEKRTGTQCRVFYYDLYGKRDDKFRFLRENDIDSVDWTELDYDAFDNAFGKTRWGKRFPYFKFFAPTEETKTVLDYGDAWGMDEIFIEYKSGVKTHGDSYKTAFTRNELIENINGVLNDDRQIIERLRLKQKDINEIKECFSNGFNIDEIKRIQYRPFDERKILYNLKFITRHRYDLMRHFIEGENVGLGFMRTVDLSVPLSQFLVTDSIIDNRVFASARGIINVAPLYLYEEPEEGLFASQSPHPKSLSQGERDFLPPSPSGRRAGDEGISGRRAGDEGIFGRGTGGEGLRRPNFKKGFVEFIGKKYGKKVGSVEQTETPVGQTQNPEQQTQEPVGQTFLSVPPANEQAGMPVLPTPEQIFGYIYAILYCPTYREKYLELLKIDFPRVPFVDDEALFFRLSELGWELAQHHLMRETYEFISNYPVAGTDEVEQVKMTPSPNKTTENTSVGQTQQPVGQTFLSDHSANEQARMPVLPQKRGDKPGRVRVWINDKQYFDNVPREVWDFYIGGYQVLDKWLKSRKGRTLTNDDITTFHRIVSILAFTINQMARIDELAGGVV